MKKLNLLFAGILFISLSACSNDEITPASSIENTNGVFICGQTYDNGKVIPRLWINNNPNNLEDLGRGGRAFDLTFASNDIYTVGYATQLSNTNQVDDKLVIWKNLKIETELTFGIPIGYGYKYSIAVNKNNNDIYVAGLEQLFQGQVPIAMIWKNGVSSLLTSNHGANPFDIEINNNDIYVVGCEPDANGIDKAVVWKNGTPTYLTDGTHDAVAQSITIIGNDIYISGREKNTAGKYIAKYWKNGVVTNLTDGTNDAGSNSIKVDNGIVYVGGFEINSIGKTVAKYWKNGVPNILTDGIDNGSVYSLSVFNNIVYAVGFNNTNFAALWTNNNSQLSIADNNFSSVIVR